MLIPIVRRRYDDAAPGTPMLARESRDCVRAATDLYGGILTEIEKAGYRVLDRRVRVSRPRLSISACTSSSVTLVIRQSVWATTITR